MLCLPLAAKREIVIFDFGCSWGYGSWQFGHKGFDIFFSSHVLEHVPSVKNTIQFGMGLLKTNGLFVAFTPNGSEEYRNANGESWNKLWGLVHPNFLDKKFYENTFSDKSFMISSTPYLLDEIKGWRNNSSFYRSRVPLDEGELLVLVKK